MLNLIPRFINERCKEGVESGEFAGAVMFVDIVGFTGITENLMKRSKVGAEVLSDIINRTFGSIIKTIYRNDGFISVFAGDAFTVVFPETNGKSEKITVLH